MESIRKLFLSSHNKKVLLQAQGKMKNDYLKVKFFILVINFDLKGVLNG